MKKPYTISVTTKGKSAKVLIEELEAKGFMVGSFAKEIIKKSKFTPTSSTYKLVGIRDDEFTDEQRTTANILAKAKELGYKLPSIEVGLYLRFIAQEELDPGYMAVMHEPICDSDGYPLVLALDRDGDGDWLGAWGASPGGRWPRGLLFLFLAPQVSSKSLKPRTPSLRSDSLGLEKRVAELERDMKKIRKFLVID